jgi:hypothetical protein
MPNELQKFVTPEEPVKEWYEGIPMAIPLSPELTFTYNNPTPDPVLNFEDLTPNMLDKTVGVSSWTFSYTVS